MHDYVIVGAGSAGCVLAARLSADPATTVLLLEAGPPDSKLEIHIPAAFQALFKTDVDWDYQTVPQGSLDGRQVYWPRGRTLGGSSSLNAQIYLRGNPADYDRWAELGNPGWGWADVLPFFRVSERNQRGPSTYHGADGPLDVSDLRDPNPLSRAFVEAAVQTGVPANDDHNGPEQDGAGLLQVTQRRGRRWSTADAYLRPARRRPNLTVVTGAQATRVTFDGRRATGVDYVHDGQARHAEAAREVLLAAGTINSPHLLLVSGVGPGGHLRDSGVEVVHDLPGVGRNLHDHIAAGVLADVSQPVTLAAAISKRHLLPYFLRRKGLLTSNVAEAAAFVRTRLGLPAPDVEVLFAPVLFVDEGLSPPPGHGVTLAVILLQPRSRGQLELASADPFAKPLIDPGYLSDPDGDDLRTLIDGVKLAREIYRAPAFDPWRGPERDPGPDAHTDEELHAHVRGIAQTLYHPVGTCRMGADEHAVVDAELRVHGLQGLRVVDASVMPVITRGHTNASAIMIAEKAATLIRGAERVSGSSASA